MTARDLITAALLDIGVLAAGEAMPASMADYALGKLNELLDLWNAKRRAVYVDRFTSHTLTPSLAPHTIGPTAATFAVTQRPVTIEAASLTLVGSTVRVPLELRDVQWYEGLTDPDLEGMPTDLYYAPDWPNGVLNLWPVPDAAHVLELQTRVVLGMLALNDTFTLPPGYEAAIKGTLAERVAPGFGQPITQTVADFAREARATIFGNNDQSRRIATADAGMPGYGGGSRFDYRTGR